MKVDVHKPEVLLQVEIRGDVINIYSIEVPGPGGMPIGTAGKAMLLLSGGIDSPVEDIWLPKEVYRLKQHTSMLHHIQVKEQSRK